MFSLRIVPNAKNEKIQWVCLSYCWGGDQPSKTTKANLDERLTLLPFADLPKTITDAITVTGRLGLRYLWVDALCIIQDDGDDVAREIATMPEVYRYAICTISASRASTSEEGFLQNHHTDDMHHSPIVLRITCPDGTPGQINLSNRGSEYRYVQEPIHKRAWCYQERILSPRIVDFGHTQVQWICKSKRFADGGRVERAASTDALLGSALQDLSQHELHDKWADIVSKYTRRDLTFAGDRLLAVSAVAAYFAPRFGCEYLAGHWKDSLALQLAWVAGRPKYTRPNVYVAPSWSWASVSDSVYWDMVDERVPAVDVLDCQVELTRSFAPLGAVSSGSLLLRGQMCEVTWYFNRSNKQTQVETGNFSFLADRETVETLPGYLTTHFQALVHRDALEPDWSSDPEASMKVLCLKLRARSQKGDSLCLFLVPAHGSKGALRRIASFRIVDAVYRFDPPIATDFFEGCERKEVKII
ncbi:HET-domain-containing protein [Ophiobolus disseminans]|uniref:HET-domain-containing protein n=1 Tax=Ophiobolus disseminans TaxID=1469910 RepID=A0A6A7AKE9_9PLEO|nr:HET-domain-containing protein [Ophiobolus disseminans]